MPKKRDASVKEIDPIPLPHDGPIHHELLIGTDHAHDGFDPHSDITMSAKLLAFLNSDFPPDEEENLICDSLRLLGLQDSSKVDDIRNGKILHFLRSLVQAKTIKGQLQACNDFKSWFVQPRGTHSCKVPDNDVGSSDVMRTAKHPPSLAIQLYQILLEWMISQKTTVPLRRTVEAILVILVHHQNGWIAIADAQRLQLELVRSCLDSIHHWNDPIQSLHDALLCETLHGTVVINEGVWNAILSFLVDTVTVVLPVLELIPKRNSGWHSDSIFELDKVAVWDTNNQRNMQRCLLVTHTIKILFQQEHVEPAQPMGLANEMRAKLSVFLLTLLNCPIVPSEHLATIGIAYGRVHFHHRNGHQQHYRLKDDQDPFSSPLIDSLSELSRAAFWQGICASVPLDQLLIPSPHTMNPSTLQPMVLLLLNTFKMLALNSMDHEARIAALHGIRAVVSRCQAMESSYVQDVHQESLYCQVPQYALDVVLQSWENPTSRNVASLLSNIFQSLVKWMQRLEQEGLDTDASQDKGPFFTTLVRNLLAQPPNRKSRYSALETLLPVAGTQAMLDGSERLIEDLIDGIGDNGHNTGAIADFWAKLLRQYLLELMMNSPTGTAAITGRVPSKWLNSWKPHLVRVVTGANMNRTQAVVAFCFPRLFSVVLEGDVDLAAQVYIAILDEMISIPSGIVPVMLSPTLEQVQEKITWARLEIARIAVSQCLNSKNESGQDELRTKIAFLIPREKLLRALTDSSISTRIAALQAMSAVSKCYRLEGNAGPRFIDAEVQEMEIYKALLPFAAKTGRDDYIAVLMENLLSFLDRLMASEAKCSSSVDVSTTTGLPLTLHFITEYLTGDMLLYLGYPGAGVDKSSFLFAILENLIVFSARDYQFNTLDSKVIPRNSKMWQRSRNRKEENTLQLVSGALLKFEVFQSLMNTINSDWDRVRQTSYRILKCLVDIAQASRIELPSFLILSLHRKHALEQSIKEALSPKPREADAGSRHLAILFHSLMDSKVDKIALFRNILDLLACRLTEVKKFLTLDHRDDETVIRLPMCHGLVKATRLIMENDNNFRGNLDDSTDHLVTNAITLFIQAIQYCLAIIADVRDVDRLEGMDGVELDLLGSAMNKRSINPGAIGANGVFSSIHRVSENEHRRRLNSQKIVMGTWLLTKEACLALAGVIDIAVCRLPPPTIDTSGKLLISTITSIKHTGAAFSAHRALQSLAERCLACTGDAEISSFPSRWTRNLLDEVSCRDLVRHSTLRRSTGLALGFLSIMRAEIKYDSSFRPLCKHVLQRLVALSLPPRSDFDAFMRKIDLQSSDQCFSASQTPLESNIVPDSLYEGRSRVHALNILRLIILDAPLSKIVTPFIGEAVASSIMGYTDSEWSIRNSSAMVFAAIMLRSIDADKNGSSATTTSSNATSIVDLFRSYPALPNFLRAVLSATVEGRLVRTHILSLPPVLPILLVLARIRPVAECGNDAIRLAEPYGPLLLRFLASNNICIRQVAARAMSNILTNEKLSTISVSRMAQVLAEALDTAFEELKSGHLQSWNTIHGVLLAVKEIARRGHESCQEIQVTMRVRKIFNLHWLAETAHSIAPCCVIAAIETHKAIWHQSTVYLPLTTMQKWLENCNVEDTVAELSQTIACNLVTLIAPKIWVNPQSSKDIDMHIGELSNILSSSCYDLREAGVKSFKKAFHECIDSIFKSEQAVFATATMIVKILSKGGVRNERINFLNLPSTRRLVRCLLMCLEALEGAKINESRWEDILVEIETLSESMIDRYSHFGCHEKESWSPILGSVVELYSFVFLQERCEVDDRFVELLSDISQPACPWHLRHSAAVAIYRIGIMQTLHEANGVSEHNKDRLIAILVNLMLDDDEDVRLAASKVSSPSSVPEIAVTLLFNSQKGFVHQSLLVRYVMVCALKEADILEQEIAWLASETSDDALETQKIFEEDEPNSYIEKVFPLQSAIVSALTSDSSTSCHREHFELLARRGHTIFTKLHGMLSNIPNSVQWFERASFFVSLHSLLSGCAFAIFLHGPSDALQAAATKLTPLCSNTLLAEALMTLSKAEQNSTRTKCALHKSCFLSDYLRRNQSFARVADYPYNHIGY